MAAQSIYHVDELSRSDIENLTQLLSLSPGETPTGTWLDDQAKCLTAFQSSHLKPSFIIPRPVYTLPIIDKTKAHLCKTHKPLKAHLIYEIFLEVSSEIITRQSTLEGNLNLPPTVFAHLMRLRSMPRLWMEPDLYKVAYPVQAPSDHGYERLPSGCPACILASIGGNHQILCDLRVSLLGRKKKGHRAPPLLRFIESWINQTGHGDVLRAESDALRKEVRKCRRQMQKARRQAKGQENAGDVGDGSEMGGSATLLSASQDAEEGDENEEYDVEGSIIDCYADHMSINVDVGDDGTGAGAEFTAKSSEDVHPAFRNSVFYNAVTGTFERILPEPLRPHRYSVSVYDDEEIGDTSPNNSDDGDGKMQGGPSIARAMAYRRLVGDDGGEETDRQRYQPARDTHWIQ